MSKLIPFQYLKVIAIYVQNVTSVQLSTEVAVSSLNSLLSSVLC